MVCNKNKRKLFLKLKHRDNRYGNIDNVIILPNLESSFFFFFFEEIPEVGITGFFVKVLMQIIANQINSIKYNFEFVKGALK